MADKQEQTAQEKQHEAQQLFDKFMADNGLIVDVFLKAIDDPSAITLRRAVKDEYSGQDWQIAIAAMFKNGNG